MLDIHIQKMPSCVGGAAQLCSLIKSGTFLRAVVGATIAGTVSGILKHYMEDYLQSAKPEDVVFNAFFVFVSLVAAFRTAHALLRYMESASLTHKLTANWQNVASTVVAFCRTSQAGKEEIDNFQNMMLRLVSLLSALCLESLENKETLNGMGHRFEVMGFADWGDDFQRRLETSPCKVEYVFQTLQQVVVDAMESKVLDISPPILTRSFQEMSAGLCAYYEAKKLSHVPFPYAYRFFTMAVLLTHAAVTPVMIAANTKGVISAFNYTFVGTCLLWFLDGVADLLDNPFRIEASTLELSFVQSELNLRLKELFIQGRQEQPTICVASERISVQRGNLAHAASMQTIRQSLYMTFTREPSLPIEDDDSPESSGGKIAGMISHLRSLRRPDDKSQPRSHVDVAPDHRSSRTRAAEHAQANAQIRRSAAPQLKSQRKASNATSASPRQSETKQMQRFPSTLSDASLGPASGAGSESLREVFGPRGRGSLISQRSSVPSVPEEPIDIVAEEFRDEFRGEVKLSTNV